MNDRCIFLKGWLLGLAVVAGAISVNAIDKESDGGCGDLLKDVPAVSEGPVSADSLPQAWTWQTDRVQEIPGGPDDVWWQQFSDPVLNKLIDLGIERNYDLRIAARRAEIARTQMNRTKSVWYPTIAASFGWQHTQPSGATSKGEPVNMPGEQYFNAGLSATWEIDLFGKIYSDVKAGRESYRASRAEYAGAMVSMTAQIASTYFTLREQQRLLQVAQAHCENQMQIVKIAEARFECTLASKLDVAQAWQTYYSTSASIPTLESSIRSTMNTLGVLIGAYPSEIQAIVGEGGPLPNCNIGLPASVPADLLRRRPDIVAAERQVAAAAASVGVARKDFLPTLAIQGSVGTASREIGHLFGDHSLTWSVAPTLTWTLFDGFARKYSLNVAREQLQSEIDSYNLAVMTAVGETDTALNAYNAHLRHIEAIQKLCVENEEALNIAVKRYKDSLSPMTDVVNAQLNALSGQSELVQAQADALNALVSVYEALGGGICPDSY